MHSAAIEYTNTTVWTKVDADCVAGELVEACSEQPGLKVEALSAVRTPFGSSITLKATSPEPLDVAALNFWLEEEQPGSEAREIKASAA